MKFLLNVFILLTAVLLTACSMSMIKSIPQNEHELRIAYSDSVYVKILLEKMYDKSIPLSNDEQRRLLYVAAERNDIDLIRYMLEFGIDISSREGNDALEVAAANGNMNLVKLLIENGVRPGSEALTYAASFGYRYSDKIENKKELYYKNKSNFITNLNVTSLITKAVGIAFNAVTDIKTVFWLEPIRIPLQFASLDMFKVDQYIEICKILIENGAEPERKSLELAYLFGHEKMFKLILENTSQSVLKDFFDESKVYEMPFICDRSDLFMMAYHRFENESKPQMLVSAISHSAAFKNYRLLDLLLKTELNVTESLSDEEMIIYAEKYRHDYYQNIDKQKKLAEEKKWFEELRLKIDNIKHNQTLLDSTFRVSATDNNPELLTMLLDAGAGINSVNEYNKTAVVYAAEADADKTLELLLKRGANPNIVPVNGYSALMRTVIYGHIATEKILLTNNVDVSYRSPKGTTAGYYALKGINYSAKKEMEPFISAYDSALVIQSDKWFESLSFTSQNFAIADSLISQGLSPDIDINIDYNDHIATKNVFEFALEQKLLNVIKYLIDKKADVNISTYTAAHISYYLQYAWLGIDSDPKYVNEMEIVKLLLKNGLNVTDEMYSKSQNVELRNLLKASKPGLKDIVQSAQKNNTKKASNTAPEVRFERYKHDNLPRSAYQLADSLYQLSKTEKNSGKILKYLFIKCETLSKTTDENQLLTIINELNTELSKTDPPIKQFLHSVQAEAYQRYYRKNEYDFSSRSRTEKFDNTDPATWDLSLLAEKINYHYIQSLTSPEILQEIKLADFAEIINSAEKNQEQPTLYDFLAQRAINFWQNKELAVIENYDRFSLDNDSLFQPAKSFSNLKFNTKDTLSASYLSVDAYQKLQRFRLAEKDTVALIALELKRLNYIYNNFVGDNRLQLYRQALRKIIAQYSENEHTADIYFQLAKSYAEKIWSSEYYYEDQFSISDSLSVAAKICDQAIAAYPQYKGIIDCKALLENIKKPALSLTGEEFYSAKVPHLFNLEYKNIDRVYYQIYRIDEKMYKNHTNNRFYRQLFLKQPIRTVSYAIQNEIDFQKHSTEFKIDNLPPGIYFIIVGNEENLKSGYQKMINNHRNCSATLSSGVFQVSNIGFLYKNNNNLLDFQFMDRESGAALPGVVVVKSSKSRADYRDKSEERFTYYRSDLFGCASVGRNEGNSDLVLKFKLDGDSLCFPNRSFSLYERSKIDTVKQTRFFTDRAIYRPGQRVYFKGIVYKTGQYEHDFNQICPDDTATIDLFVNYSQKVNSIKVKTNEFGSFNAYFDLPVGQLNGSYRIGTKTGSVDIRVEEYKRPKFFATFEPLKQEWGLNDLVEIKIKAEAFAGYKIDRAKVNYKVSRETYYPCWWLYQSSYNDRNIVQIADGETVTDSTGKAVLSFNSIPDRTAKINYNPAFIYRITCDITDQNGESHSINKEIRLGATALELRIDLPEKIDLQNKSAVININTTSLNGDTLSARGKITIYRLSDAGKPYRSRKWNLPDRSIISAAEFAESFPFDMYQSPDSIFKKEKIYRQFDFNTGLSNKAVLSDLIEWQCGNYLLEAEAHDKNGNLIKDSQKFSIFDSFSNKMPFSTANWFCALISKVEVGDTARFVIGSSDEQVRMIFDITKQGRTIEKKIIEISNEQQIVKIPVTEALRGGFYVSFSFYKHNRIYNNGREIEVPYSNKQLNLFTEVMHKKMEPGKPEEWKIKIKDRYVKAVKSSELMAVLYDASLETFVKHKWSSVFFSSRENEGTWIDDHTQYVLNGSNFSPCNRYYYQEKFSPSLNFSRTLGNLRNSNVTLDCISMATVAGVKADPTLAGSRIHKSELPKKQQVADPVDIPIRKNFNETAFFYPNLVPNDSGEVIIKFTAPEALTKWKILAFAQTKDLQSGYLTAESVTQLPFMVVSNFPRFIRQGDEFVLTAKVVNQSDSLLNGNAELEILEAGTLKPLTKDFVLQSAQQQFSASKNSAVLLSWKLKVPANSDAVIFRVKAHAQDCSDGEEIVLPILKNQMLVTESLPLQLRGNQAKNFSFKKLLDSKKSKSLINNQVILEFSSNPVWQALQALPYLMEYPHECIEQTFSRYYANSLATYIVNSNPKIKEIYQLWQNTPDSSTFSSALAKSQDLKSLILAETPWVLNAKNESQNKKRIAQLFDIGKMAIEERKAREKIFENQLPSGAWGWFPGLRENRYITQHIVSGFARLGNLKVVDIQKDNLISTMLTRAVKYLDYKIADDYCRSIRVGKTLNYEQINYLYARSFFPQIKLEASAKTAFDYYIEQAKTYWAEFNFYGKGQICLALNRYQDSVTAKKIVKSLKEYAIHNEDLGMFWKIDNGYYWHESSIETHALMTEVFSEVANNQKSVDEIKTWLLKSKQTQNWPTTKSTTEAVYALLLRGRDWLSENNNPEIQIGKSKIVFSDSQIERKNKSTDKVINQIESGSGYFKTNWSGNEIIPEMGNVTVKNNNNVPAWGAVYWQYFEDLDKITSAETPLKLKKQLFVERISDNSTVIIPVDKEQIRVGDRIKVRIELRVDRDMEFIHMKDMRASAFEPENVLSSYKWQDGLVYYESTKDASTNFFFDRLPKGTYVFEYALKVTNEGNFSNGITTIQSMYAPEFTSHSEGVRVKVRSR